MAWHAIWEKKPKYNQTVLVANPYGRLRYGRCLESYNCNLGF